MDIENLIERLKECSTYGFKQEICGEAADALSTIQAENAQLRAYLEYEREHADAYYEECGQWETENEKLRAELKQVKAERDAAAKKLTREAAEAALKGEQNGRVH